MLLSEEKKQQFITWLEGETAINFKCSICYSDDWVVLDEVIILSSMEGGGYPNVGLICQCCKHTVLFNATESGVMDKPDSNVFGDLMCTECLYKEATMQKDGEYLCSDCYNDD